MRRQCRLADEAATMAVAGQIAAAAAPGTVITLKGPLAAGKTTFARGFLRALGHSGKVKSPTFTLVETYTLQNLTVHHFDLYRLGKPGELYYMGFDDYVGHGAICLIEWPERGGDLLPVPDLEIVLEPVTAEIRTMHLSAATPAGILMLEVVPISR